MFLALQVPKVRAPLHGVILFAGIWLYGNTCITAKDVKFVLPTTTTGADALFNTYRRTGEDHWVVELSSIGLAEDRLPLPLEGLVWTTFEPEHMDYHKTTYAYYLAKKKAFSYLKKVLSRY